ncbi:hypothetical protein QJQ45_008789 [Haematococcus lacustris]|nr:hypothetical protein QJQ45_008789 [Haematococcus lacustris]
MLLLICLSAAVTETQATHAAMQADRQHAAQPHHHLPALTAAGWHDQPPDTEMQDSHAAMQADMQHAAQPHHHLPALTAAGWHDQPPDTEMQDSHAAMQADMQHVAQPHHHLPALTAAGWHDQPAVTETQATHAAMQADMQHAAQPHHHLPALTAAGWHDQPAVTETQATHAAMQADRQHAAQPHHHLPALTAAGWHDQPPDTEMQDSHAAMQADMQHVAQPHHHLPALTAAGWHDQPAVTETQATHAARQADMQHAAQPHHHLPALTAAGWHDQPAVTETQATHAAMQADMQHAAQPHHHLPALTAAGWHDQPAVTETQATHAAMQADMQHAAQPHHHLPALTAAGWHDQPAVTETQATHAAMQADMQHAAQPHHHLPALTAAGWHDQPAVTETQATHAAMQADMQHAAQPHHHLPALTAAGWHDQPAVTETQATHAAMQADKRHTAQQARNMLRNHTIRKSVIIETNITTVTWLCTCSVTSFKKTAIDNMDRRYTIITPMPNPPFGHPNWTPIQQLDMNRQIVAYLACVCLWISMCMKRHQPTYSHTKSRKCLKKQHKTLAKLNASLHNTTYNWLLGIDGTLPSATAITRLNHIAYTYLKGHNSGRTIRAIQYNTTLQAYMTYYLNPNTSSPTWLMAISTYMARCIHISWLLLAAGDIEPNPGPDGLYFEQQVASHCQIHALNMAAGHSWLTNQELANFHTSELHARQGEQRTMWALARDEQGACNDTVINLYLTSHYGLSTHTVAHLRAKRDWSTHNLDALSATHGTNAFLCKAPAHSMAIRKHDGAWYLLDSQANAPIQLRTTGHYAYPVTCEIQAIISTTNYTAEMEAARQRARLGPIISNPQETHRPYWEKQYKKCCLAHAINMAMGQPMIIPDDVITHCKTLGTHIQDLAIQARQENRHIPLPGSLPHIYDESGNFTISTMNHYLYHYHKDLHLCPAATELTPGNITPELLTTLTDRIDSYTNTAAILITHNHATTIRHIDNAWQWLDSERGRPWRLDTPEDWLQLHGMLVLIKKGDAANTNLIQPLCWLADPTRRATTEQLEQHLRAAHVDLTNGLRTQPAHSPRSDRPPPKVGTAQPANNKRDATATEDTHPANKHAQSRQRQAAPTVTLSTPQSRTRSDKRPTSTGHPNGTFRRRTKPKAQPRDSHKQTLIYQYTAPTPPPAAHPTDNPSVSTEAQHSTLPTRQPQPTHNRQHITLTTLNVRSLHRSRKDVLNLVHQHSPDILVLTETMTQPKSNNPGSGWLKRVMPDYTTHRHRGHSEVLIGIKHNLAIQMQTKMLPPCTDAEVNARCVILTLNQHQCEQLTIIATYWPSGNNGDALSLRGKMQEHIRTATGHLPGSLILAGDINATMKTEDRSEHTEYTQDNMMRGFATEMHLKEADPDDRAWTYQQPHCKSRIDAILTRDARHGPEHRTHIDTNAYLSDHRPLTATLNTARLGIALPAPHKPPKHIHTILTTPITNKDREAYRLAVQQPSSGVPQLHAELTAFLAPIYTEATHHLATLGKTNPQQPHRLTTVAGLSAREAVDTAATMLTHLLQTCRTAAIKTCNTKTLTRGGQHYQRRTMCRIRLALGRKLKTTRAVLGDSPKTYYSETNVHPTIDDLIPETDATNGEIRDAVQARQGDDTTDNHVQAALAQLTNTYRDQIHQLDDDDSALAIAQARVRMQQLISTQPKKANKRILRPSRTDHKGLQALADPDTKTICTAPADLSRIITDAYGTKLAPPTPKTGNYTNTQTRNYPWARAKADDAFAMHACQNIHWLHTAIMDKAGFQECLSRLAGGKAPGPDGVENEIIKMLPWEMRETIHQLFIIMWATGCTPTTWKTSDTCLLYKDKGEETDLNSYRPVGLANTVYKLWTSLITKTLSEYAEANGMLSKNQAGFRSHRNTTQQLQMLVMALEDAKLAKADIYALLVDFTSAFNTTCQDKLLWIMHDLGFPTDATDAVKDLYTGATTRFKTPYGHTDPVPVDRGTIQGDSLSPFLFLIYIEPLLRWLQVGARGYKFKSATADSGERATVSSIDYADDIAILCNTLRNLRCQADKLSAFSDWGHLIISHSKTLATAALHHSIETGMCSNAAEADKRARQQLQTVSLQGKPVTYHRPTSPFTYLGVLITMTLDWKPQHTAMITQLRQKLERLRRSFASARQAIHIIRTAIIPSLAYSFCAVPCTPGDLELYDRSINQCVKLKLRLPLGTPNAIIREDAGKLGMGISSTAQEYHARNTTALTHSLQSTDVAHAHISRSMLHKQITWLSTQASTQGHRMLTLLHHTLRARQLVYASISGLSATEKGLPLYHEKCQTLGRLITQASSSQAHDVVSASITCLKSLGVTHASELSCKGNTHIITGSMLTSKYGKKVKQKHIIALNKLAAMAAQPSCPDATVTRTIRDSRNTSLDLPPDQRRITPWAAGLTELAPTPAVPDTRTRYMDMKAYAVKHATQPATADRTAAAPAANQVSR